MTGIQEILTLILLIGCLFLLPRLFGTRHTPSTGQSRKFSLSGKCRLAIVLSLLIPIAAATLFPPWQPRQQTLFCLTGILPVALGWAGFWVFQGFRNK